MSKNGKSRTRPPSSHPRPADRGDIAGAYRLLQAGDYAASQRICRALLRANPADPDANNCLGVVHQRLGNPAAAVSSFEKALASDPAFVPAYGNLANSLAQLGRIDDARRVVDRALGLRPESAIANRALADLAYTVSEFERAEESFRRSLSAAPDDFHSYNGLGMVLRRLGRLDEARACYERAIQLQPDHASIHLNLGNLLSDMGRTDDAAESYRRSIRLRPDNAGAHQLLATARRHTSRDDDVRAMEAFYARPGISTEDRMNLAFGLGKAFDDLGEYDKAFEYFVQANNAKRTLSPYSIDEDAKFFARLESTFTERFCERRRGLGSDDPTPIFVLGMPRSGTSLVEQILACHPQIRAAGELADLQQVCEGAVDAFPDQIPQIPPDAWKSLALDYLARLRVHDRSATHITDKMPINFLYIGMIALMLPNAKIIHCRRDPKDTCLSLYKNLFVADGYQWSFDLEDLGRYHGLYSRLMAHWIRLFPGRIHEIHYEDLVADTEGQVRRMLDYCGLPFDPACLSFHESRRAVSTLSFAQVRQPIYSSSVGLWKRYERHLQPLLDQLADSRTATG